MPYQEYEAGTPTSEILHLVQSGDGLGGVPLTKCNSPPIKGHCTNHYTDQ